MPHNQKADASVTVTGVSLCCVNPTERRWEVAFIHGPKHSLMMEVTKQTNGQSVTIRPNSVITPASTISIEATNDERPFPQLFTPDGADADCPENFNLVLDLEGDIYGKPISFKRPEVEVTALFVAGPLVYSVAGKVTDFPVRMIERGDKDSKRIKVFGHISAAVAADINCGKDGGEVSVKVEGDGGFELHLPREEGTTYLIKLDNTCPPDPAPPVAAPPAATSPEANPAAGLPTPVGTPAGADSSSPPPPGETSDEDTGDRSDFVFCYSVVDPPADAEEFDLVDDLDPDTDHRGDGAVCTTTSLSMKTSIFPLPT